MNNYICCFVTYSHSVSGVSLWWCGVSSPELITGRSFYSAVRRADYALCTDRFYPRSVPGNSVLIGVLDAAHHPEH